MTLLVSNDEDLDAFRLDSIKQLVRESFELRHSSPLACQSPALWMLLNAPDDR